VSLVFISLFFWMEASWGRARSSSFQTVAIIFFATVYSKAWKIRTHS
jgi:hypothetical protein